MNKLKEYRKLRGVSQQKLSIKSETSRSYISEVENGNKKLTLKRARLFGEILNVDPFELLGTDAIKYSGDFERTLRALIDSNFDRVIRHTLSNDLPAGTWSLYWIIFDILNSKFSDADIAAVKAVVDSIKQKYEAPRQ